MKKSYTTILSTALFEIISSSKTPLLYKEISTHMEQQNLLFNKSSVYRQLDSMKRNKEITSIETSHGTAWEVVKNNHAHISCDTCEKIVCLEIPLQAPKNEQLNNLKFTAIKTQFTGICEQCVKQ